MKKAVFVVVMTPFATDAMKEYADVLLPVASFAETSGSYVNMEGFWQSAKGCVPPPGEARPAWKVLRVLANQFDLTGFDFVSSNDVLQELKTFCSDVQLNNDVTTESVAKYEGTDKLQRVGDTPI